MKQRPQRLLKAWNDQIHFSMNLGFLVRQTLRIPKSGFKKLILLYLNLPELPDVLKSLSNLAFTIIFLSFLTFSIRVQKPVKLSSISLQITICPPHSWHYGSIFFLLLRVLVLFFSSWPVVRGISFAMWQEFVYDNKLCWRKKNGNKRKVLKYLVSVMLWKSYLAI